MLKVVRSPVGALGRAVVMVETRNTKVNNAQGARKSQEGVLRNGKRGKVLLLCLWRPRASTVKGCFINNLERVRHPTLVINNEKFII